MKSLRKLDIRELFLLLESNDVPPTLHYLHDFVELHSDLEELTLRENKYSRPTRKDLLITFQRIINLQLKSLSIFCDSLDNRNLSELLRRMKSSLKEVHLHIEGYIDSETYKVLLNEMPKLKTLWLRRNGVKASSDDINRIAPDVSFLDKNHTIETLNISGSHHVSTSLIKKLPNVKRIILEDSYLKLELWQSVSIHMKQLTVLHINYEVGYYSLNLSDLKFSSVKELSIQKFVDAQVRQPNQPRVDPFLKIIERFPNLEKLKIEQVELKNAQNSDSVILQSIADSCKYLKVLQIEKWFFCDFSALIYLLKSCELMKLIVLPKFSIRLNVLDVNLINDLKYLDKRINENRLVIIEKIQ